MLTLYISLLLLSKPILYIVFQDYHAYQNFQKILPLHKRKATSQQLHLSSQLSHLTGRRSANMYTPSTLPVPPTLPKLPTASKITKP
jgi:hypothetical protein